MPRGSSPVASTFVSPSFSFHFSSAIVSHEPTVLCHETVLVVEPNDAGTARWLIVGQCLVLRTLVLCPSIHMARLGP